MPISRITGASIEDGSIVIADLGITTFNTGTGNTLTLQANSATGLVIDVTGNTAIANSLSFSATGARIRGDFTNTTQTSKVAFQTSTTDGATVIAALPNGTGTISQWRAYNSNDPTNSGWAGIVGSTASMQLQSGITGTGTYLPLTMLTGGSERLRIDTSGNVGIGTASPVEKLTVTGQISTSTDLVLKESTTARGYIFGTSAGLTYRATSTLPHIFQNVGTELMRLDATGNLGIGTASPSQRLHVAAGTILVSNTSSTSATVAIAGNGSTVGTSAFELIQGGSSEAYVYNRANSFLVLGTNNAERMRITSGGDVGIGASSTDPFSRVLTRSVAISSSGAGTSSGLFITSGAGSRVQLGIGSTSTLLIYSDSTNFSAISTETAMPLLLQTNQTERMRIDSNGNVGIGTSSPSALLHVNGTARATSISLNGISIGDYGLYNSLVARVGNGNGIGINSANSTDNAYIYFGYGTTSPQQQGAAIGRIGGDVLSFFTAATQRMSIDSSGNVGINVTPSAKFSVGGSGTFYGSEFGVSGHNGIRVGSSNSYYWEISREGISSGHLMFIENSNNTITERMRINPGGSIQLSTAGTSILNSSGRPILRQTGSILQVISTFKNDLFSASLGGGSFTDITGFSATITPSSSSSRILVLISCSLSAKSPAVGARLLRDGTLISNGPASGSRLSASTPAVSNAGDGNRGVPTSITFLDSPGTTSAVTYKLQIGAIEPSGTHTAFFNTSGADDNAGYTARTASSIILLEIAG